MADSVIATLLLEGPNLSREVDITLGETTIGRQSSNEVHVPSPLVSRQHARIYCDENGCQLEDLGSSNGTVLNGEPLDAQVRVMLKDGDLIEIGPFQMAFKLAEATEAAPEPVEEVVAEEIPTSPEAEQIDELDAAPEPPIQPQEAEPPVQPQEAEPKARRAPQKAKAPTGKPPSPPFPPAPNGFGKPDELAPFPPGLDRHSRRYMEFLPPIYHTDFMSRFLALFEAILMPVEWTVDSFDLFLDPKTAPSGFLPWLQNWFLIAFDDTWSDEKRRVFLQDAYRIYERKGTKWSLERILAIYLGEKPEIDDDSAQLEPLTFLVRIPFPEANLDREIIENLIDLNKPAHTTYQLSFSG